MAEDFVEVRLGQPAEQLQLLVTLRQQLSEAEFVFEDGEDVGHPLLEALTDLKPERQEHRGTRYGYHRARPGTVSYRCRYHRSIRQALAALGGLFLLEVDDHGWDKLSFSGLGNVDLVLRDDRRAVVLYTVTHEGLVFVRRDLLPLLNQ